MEVSSKGFEYMFNQYLSFLDLECHEDFKKVWSEQDKRGFEKVLMSMGADLNFGWEIKVCLHRSRFSEKVDYGPRITFKERTDKYWIKNGMQLEDIVREVDSTISRVGMILAMNADTRSQSIVSGDEESTLGF